MYYLNSHSCLESKNVSHEDIHRTCLIVVVLSYYRLYSKIFYYIGSSAVIPFLNKSVIAFVTSYKVRAIWQIGV